MSNLPKQVKLIHSEPRYWHYPLRGEIFEVVGEYTNTAELHYYVVEPTNEQKNRVTDMGTFYIRKTNASPISYSSNQEAVANLLKKG